MRAARECGSGGFLPNQPKKGPPLQVGFLKSHIANQSLQRAGVPASVDRDNASDRPMSGEARRVFGSVWKCGFYPFAFTHTQTCPKKGSN